MNAARETQFLNVDLEVTSASDLSWLVEELGEDVVNLYCGPARGHFLATFETTETSADPNTRIGTFCLLVENLPERSGALGTRLSSKSLTSATRLVAHPRRINLT